MRYPTLNQVEAADRMQLCCWHRFLESPGWSAVGCENAELELNREAAIQDRIQVRLKEAGGFTPQISKEIGW